MSVRLPSSRSARTRRRGETPDSPSGPVRATAARITLKLLAVALAGAGLAPPVAHAGTYEMHNCTSPSGARAPLVADWSASKGDIDDNCSAFGSATVRLSQSTLPNGERGGLEIAVPATTPNARIAAFRASLSTNVSSGSNSFLSAHIGPLNVFHQAFPTSTGFDTTYGLGVTPGRSLSISAICNNTAAYSECSYADGRPFTIRGLTLLLQEDVAPTATFAGSLVGTGPKDGVHTLVVTGHDTDSGVRGVDLLIDGKVVGTASFAAACNPLRWRVCPENPSHTFTVDTTGMPDGDHAVAAVVTDHAGNTRTEEWGDIVVANARVGGTRPIDDFDGDGRPNEADPDDDNDGIVDTSDPDPFNPRVPGPGSGGSTVVIVEKPRTEAPTVTDAPKAAEAPKPAELGAGAPLVPVAASNGAQATDKAIVTVYGRTSKQTRTVRYGSRVAMTGRVTDELGRPIAGAVLTVEQQAYVPRVGPAPGAAWKPVVTATPVVTARDGSYRYVVPAGASRTVRIAYKSRLDATQVTATQDLVVQVVGKATLRVSKARVRNGQKVTFSGRLLGGNVPRTGVTVALQARTPRGWVTFRTTRARANGAFSGAYRFHATTGVRVYEFRASVNADSGYPFLPGRSNTTKVTVRGS